MTPEDFKAALDTLGLSPAAIAKMLGVDVRTARRWATGGKGIPDTVAAQVADLLTNGITPEARVKSPAADAVMAFLWVRRQGDQEWTVAEHDRVADFYYLPGRIERYVASELVLGPAIEVPGL
ncbi:helix-turn-helix domain-containing protein [Ancylobacter oerskovii]|uniref:Helix-turn-helix domain-containing protein n=1 Tax=Ancylobacter oerskovii TaxID=459519 RepID=A0ABW4YX67_9HYPH|nr:helix-turn-helix domain-containing protein [Ancylobacter oerskovii]MBS7542064.1 helix-turn-helix transcriptional regulator [Ancylobacter oerskovii]